MFDHSIVKDDTLVKDTIINSIIGIDIAIDGILLQKKDRGLLVPLKVPVGKDALCSRLLISYACSIQGALWRDHTGIRRQKRWIFGNIS